MGLPKGQTNNPNGRPKGSKNETTLQWEALHESIVGCHAESFNARLDEMMNSDDPKQQARGMEMYIKILKHFRPSYANIQHSGDKVNPVQIIVGEDI